ncbi:hypothetical protein AD940_14230 [Gluconobacter thailandicus]|uniref:hypothetical protein n=1 Tax=Gluconobacter thailandicus TaxID=257438 RepID=UPI0007770797|nr:hypothetical protein [Gluconobacter thailandicus]KXV33098.1 hypothetical protein AD940_14230 [Gluconobacter thailandicus]
MTNQTPAPAVQDGQAALRATLFEQTGNEKLRNIKFVLDRSKETNAEGLAAAANRFILNRRNKKIRTFSAYEEAHSSTMTVDDFLSVG